MIDLENFAGRHPDRYKLGRNDPCWCNSGRKYKRCHLGRSSESRLPFSAIESKVRGSSYYSTCLHPEASAENCGKKISAHTLQRARVLEAIADHKRQVLTFFPHTRGTDGSLKLHSRGWRQASTFDAFCAKHDASTFRSLETVEFLGTKEQIFLIAYRAICWELYQKIRAVRSGPAMRDLVDRGASEQVQQFVQEFLRVQDAGFRKGQEVFGVTKKEMDSALRAKDYSAFEGYEVVFEGKLAVASTGAISPNRSLSGAELQVIHKVQQKLEWLAFGVDVRASGFSFVFLWSRDDSAPRQYVDDLDRLTDRELAEFLVQFLFAHCENTYFAASWWHSLEPRDQKFLTGLAANPNPYYNIPKYELKRRLATWRIVGRNRS